MATERQLPADFAAALNEVPAARDRFAALPAQRQGEWLAWIDRGRGGRGRAARIDEAIRRLAPTTAVAEEEVVEPAPPPTREWWPWLLLLLLLVVGGLLAWYFLTRGDDKTTVPNVIGLRQQVAERRIHDAGLKSLTATGPSDKAQGVVFEQRPGAGTQLGDGQEVTITISSGLARSPIPDVTGDPIADAQSKLLAAGFKGQVKRVASTRQKGQVVDQEPLAGVTAVKGSTVVVSVSTGVQPVVVPTVVGLSQNDAVKKLTDAKLVPQIQNAPSTKPEGTVFAQKPSTGKQVDKGSAVTINVSSGPGTGGGGTTTPAATTTTSNPTTTTGTAPAARVSVPNVRGLAVVAGLRRTVQAGLRLTVTYVSASQRKGIIVAQSPAGGSSVAQAGRVRISVSNGPNPGTSATVPDVGGQDQGAATTALQDAGFKVIVFSRRTSDPAKEGVVVEQQPVAGSDIPRGSYVAIFVGSSS